MNAFERLFRHSDWATGKVLAGLSEAGPELLARESRPSANSNLEALRHMAGTERAFLDAISSHPVVPEPPRDLGELTSYCAETIAGFQAFLATTEDLGTPVYIPWWERSFAVEDCLLQVLAHSAQHRAELAWELARAGIDTGELDYIIWVDQNES
ncbi:MAG: DinB family protein [Dehalococcoidia bacterium]